MGVPCPRPSLLSMSWGVGHSGALETEKQCRKGLKTPEKPAGVRAQPCPVRHDLSGWWPGAWAGVDVLFGVFCLSAKAFCYVKLFRWRACFIHVWWPWRKSPDPQSHRPKLRWVRTPRPSRSGGRRSSFRQGSHESRCLGCWLVSQGGLVQSSEFTKGRQRPVSLRRRGELVRRAH